MCRHFKKNNCDQSKADCKLCTANLSKVKTKCSTFNTTNLTTYLKIQTTQNSKCFLIVAGYSYSLLLSRRGPENIQIQQSHHSSMGAFGKTYFCLRSQYKNVNFNFNLMIIILCFKVKFLWFSSISKLL